MIQLGTRWGFGTTPPPRLTGSVADEIGAVERALMGSAPDPGALASRVWTLTWLEGRPIAELDLDDEDGAPIVVTLDVGGAVTSRPSDGHADDEAW